MKTRLTLVFLFVAGSLFPAPQSEPEQLGAITGTVTDAITNQGLRKAFVRLSGNSGTYPVVTEEGGRFSIEGVQPGSYVLEVEHQGYIEWRLGEIRESDDSTLYLTLAPGQTLADISAKLTPQSVISGRVVDEDGEVWTHAHVNIFRSEFVKGRRKLQGFNGDGDVNDLGEFRIGQLPPGKYYLSAESNADWEMRNEGRSKEKSKRLMTWYPSAPDPESGTPILVTAGTQTSGLEIRLRRGSVHNIRGTLVGGENIPEERQRYFKRQISLESITELGPNEHSGLIHPDGTFEIRDVPSGAFEIHVRQGLPPVILGSTKIQVEERDIEDVSIQLTPPRPLKGMIRIEGDSTTTLADFTVELDPLIPALSPSARSQADGSFEMPLVGSESYRVVIFSNTFYLKEVRYGDIVSHNGLISLTGASSDLLLTLSSHGAHLTGRVSGTDDKQIGTPQVVLVASDPTVEPRLPAFDQNHMFSLDNIPPGAYKLYAFEEVPYQAWEDAEFMKEFAGAGTEVHFDESESKNVEVPLLSKSSVAAALKKLGLE